MNSLIRKVFAFLALFALISSATNTKNYQLRSPCVSNKGPCSFEDINTWMYEDEIFL